MGGAAPIPGSTSSFQAYTPNALDWQKQRWQQAMEAAMLNMQAQNFGLQAEKHGLQMAYYQPMLQDALAKRKLFKGVMKGDTKSLGQFAGTPKGTSKEDIVRHINAYRGIEPRTAAAGGIMQLRGYADGGNTASKPEQPLAYAGQGTPTESAATTTSKPEQPLAYAGQVGPTGTAATTTSKTKAPPKKPGLTPDQAAFVQQMAKLSASGKELTKAQQDRLNKIETLTGRDVSPYTNTGTQTPANKGVANAATQIKDAYGAGDTGGDAGDAGGAGGAGKPLPSTNPYTPEKAIQPPTYGVIGGELPSDPIRFTDPWANKALDYLGGMQAPAEWDQAGQMYKDVYAGLGGLTNFRPDTVAAERTSALQATAQQAAAERATAERATAERATAAQMAQIANINAERVNLGKYNVNAAQMQRPEDVAAREIQAQQILGAQMQRPEDVRAQALQRYQMDSTAPISTQDLEAYQMAGPGSWTDEGVAAKYMSPYMQGVIDITKRETERDYTKQMNALAAKAKSAGAFGGARQALERAEAQRNFNQQLQDIQTKGLQSAYESGRSQYGQELSLSQQAALQNLQSKLSTQSQSSQQALQAMLANQNIDYQTKLQNLQAMLGVQSQEAQQMLNASLANQQAALITGQQNLQAEMQKQLANQQSGMTAQQANQQAFLQAALANQQSGLTVGQTNAQLAQQAALANQSMGAQGDLANQDAALRAALANQQTQFGVGSLNANLANQVALQNAALGTQASLQNAQLGTQTNWQNAANALQASLQNAQLGTQVSMQNAQLGTQNNWQNAQNALQASLANQQAGIAGAGLNLNAYNAQGNMAQGLGALGNQNAAWQQQMLTNYGNAASLSMGAGQNLWNNVFQGYKNAYDNSNLPTTAIT